MNRRTITPLTKAGASVYVPSGSVRLQALSIAIARRSSALSGAGPAHDRQGSRVRHGDETKDAEGDIGNLPKLGSGDSLVVQHWLLSLLEIDQIM